MTDDAVPSDFSYDRVAYPSPVLEGLTPTRLRASAMLHGYSPPDAATASVLEIGCGDGLGLVAWAAAAPKARAVGFDLSPGAVAKGRDLAEAAGLTNVDLHPGDILTYPRDGEKFDYIVCHGVLSWVPDAVRSGLIELIGARLAPGGIAYVSYDCMPGAAHKAAIVPFLRSRVAATNHAMTAMRSSAVVVDMLNRNVRRDSALREQIDILIETMLKTEAGYFYHDWLAEYYAPVDLRRFIAAVAGHNLRLAGSAANTDVNLVDLDDEAKALLASYGDDDGSRLLLVDLLRGPSIFHRDLLVRIDAPPPRITGGHKAVTYGFGGSRETVETKEGTSTKFSLSETFAVTPRNPESLAVLDLLHASKPAELSYADILDRTGVGETQLRDILYDVCRNGFVSSRTTPEPFVLTPGERPLAGALVRAMAQRSERVIDLRSEDIEIEQDETRLMLVFSDGTRTRAEIAAAMSAELEREIPVTMVEGAIAHYARHRLFSA